MNAYQFIVKMKDHATSGLRNIARSAGVADDRVGKLKKQSTGLGSVFRGLAPIIATVFTVTAIVGFTSKVIEARQEYERFDAVLTNTFQSADVGKGALNMLTDFAAKTPFQLNELTGSFVKLVNRGFLPAKQQLREMGDLAASQGKSFDQLTEAVLDAQTGEFERLKEFGIKASKAGDQVSLSFKGVTETIANNDTAITNAILRYGQMAGVAGSMDAISKTLGGRISNLKDQWWNFLVAVGGESGGVLSGFIDAVSASISFLSTHLGDISMWFSILWSYISPVVDQLREFVSAAFGFTEAGSVLSGFANIMSGVLLVVDYFTTGLMTIIDWLHPFAGAIGIVTAAWALFNLMVAISPLGWIVIAIVAVITVIGMLTKYTDGWSESWQALKNIFSLVWESIKADFQFGINSFKNGFSAIILSGENAAQKIIGRFTKVGEAIQMALDGDFSGAWDKAFETVNTKAEEELKKLGQNQIELTKEWAQGKMNRAKQMQEEWGKVGITLDTEGIAKDFQGIKDKFSNIGAADTSGSSAYDDYLAGARSANGENGTAESGAKKGADTIVSGGTKHTNINITIQKLQDDTKIYVSSKEEGLSQLGDKVQEILLRAVNSVNQMQTA